MKVVWNILGILFIVAGAGWALQGLKIINYGAMAGHRRWILIGGILFVIGVILLIINNRKKVKA
jgi:hypothetical protein